MNFPVRHDSTARVLFALTLALFFAFFAYMVTNESVSVYTLENTHDYTVLESMERTVLTDDTAPLGIVKVYEGVLDPDWSRESCLCFVVSHHHVEVYFDGELVYRLTGDAENSVGGNVGSNWCFVHVGQEHAGETVRVVLTPLFEAAVSKEPVFLMGSHYAVAMDVLMGELSMLILSALCILLGIFVVAVSAYFKLMLKTGSGGLAYLGSFSVALGLWKLMDLECVAMLWQGQTMAANYISVGSLFLGGYCLLMYLRTLFGYHRRGGVLPWAVGGLICLNALLEQLFGSTELRQNLIWSHILLIIAVFYTPLVAVYNRIVHKSWSIDRSWRLLGLLILGIGLDLGLYYVNGANGLVSFSVVGFIIYLMIVFLRSIQRSTRLAYTDSRTGLENRVRWNELMNSSFDVPEPYAILVIDLNGLKRVNDTLGHEAGDRMIYELSSILRNTLPRSSTICRWGGDEFTVLLAGLDRAMLDRRIESLREAGDAYNLEHPDLPIHFAVGTALSTEHSGMPRTELFRLADEDMYRDKQSWYAGEK